MCYDGLEFENGALGEDEIDRARPRPTVERHEDDVDRYPLLSTTSQARQRSTVAAPCVPQAKRSSTKLHASGPNAAKIRAK